MNKKHSISNLLTMLYLLYAIYFMEIIGIGRESGILTNNNLIIKYLPVTYSDSFSGSQVLFYYLFLGFICFGVINEGRDMDIYTENNKLNIVNKKLLKYKIFIAGNLIFSSYLLLKGFNVSLLNACALTNISAVFIYYGKSIYFKSYICNRKLEWLKKTANIDVNENIDTKWWRKKIWFNKREKIPFIYRLNKIITSTFMVFMSSLFLILFFLLKSLLIILVIYFLIKNLLILIEAIFGLYTSTEGKCTGVMEKSRRKRIRSSQLPIGFTFTKVYYEIVLTDYNHKREIEIISDESYGLSEMDNLMAIHGIFSKDAISINLIPTHRVSKKTIVINLLVRLGIMCLLGYICFNTYKDYLEYKNGYSYYEEYNYEEDDPFLQEQRKNNMVQPLLKDEDYYEKIITINEEKSSENVDIKVEKLYLGKNQSKLQFKMKNKTETALVLNIPYETHVYDKNNNKNSNILLPNEEYTLEMDINKSSKNAKLLHVKLEYTLSPYVMHEYGDYFDYSYYPLNVVDCYDDINIDLTGGKCDIQINEYGQFYNISQDIVEFR